MTYEKLDINSFKDSTLIPTAAQISSGQKFPPVKLIGLLSPDEWEDFTLEWLTLPYNDGIYKSLLKAAGPNDHGLDIITFKSRDGFDGRWDSFQCKRYESHLCYSDIEPELAKVIYYSFLKTEEYAGKFPLPDQHVFIASKGVGTSLSKLLKNPSLLRKKTISKWNEKGFPKLSESLDIKLTSDLKKYLDEFDFSIFTYKPLSEIIIDHSKTQYHVTRFGNKLPPRGPDAPPPDIPEDSERLYVSKILDAYSEDIGESVTVENLEKFGFSDHFSTQRTCFYCAESLKSYAQDTTPQNTFEALEDDIYQGVVDLYELDYKKALDRLRSTLAASSQIDLSGNALKEVTRTRDRKGICHQLANKNRFTWIKK